MQYMANLYKNMANKHNLDIQSYSLEEILGLFDLSYQLTPDDMKRAKKKVLMLHPDKSKLDAKYFLFYKKAFEVVFQLYEDRQKQNQPMPTEPTVYQTPENMQNETARKKINENMKQMGETSFQNKFNQLYEENMSRKPDSSRNAWFVQEKANFDIPTEGVSSKNMDQAFHQIKQQSSGLVKYQGVQDMMQSQGGSSFYDDDDTDNNYISSTPFGKLKFDDLRKVHKDETVFAVSERDFQNVQTYKSVDDFNRARNQHSYEPMEQQKANQILQQQEEMNKQRALQREYQSQLQSQQYAEKNKTVFASFLQIKNK
jgi:hypothetical protein